MKRIFTIITLIAVVALTGIPLLAQDANADRVTVNWSDPSKPGLLKVHLIMGGITVKTHSGRDVIIEARGRNDNRRGAPAEVAGLKRIDSNASGLTVEESNNVMTVGSSNFTRCCPQIEIQ